MLVWILSFVIRSRLCGNVYVSGDDSLWKFSVVGDGVNLAFRGSFENHIIV